jgi:hypothetical protein
VHHPGGGHGGVSSAEVAAMIKARHTLIYAVILAAVAGYYSYFEV